MTRLFFAVLSCLALAACSGVQRESTGAVVGAPLLGNKAGPNIIYILADDLGYGDLGAYGQAQIQTPVLDRLAARGLRLTDHYAGSTVCAPSRCVLMTGKHTGRCYIRGNGQAADGYNTAMPAGEPSLARVLQDAGYTTACIGKWGMGGPESTSSPRAFGFDFFYGFLDQRHAHNHFPDYLWRNGKREPTGNVMTDASRLHALGAGVAVERVAYANDLFFKESTRWMDEQAKGDKPFFLYLAMTVPHANSGYHHRFEHMPEAGKPQRGQEVPDLGPYADRDWPGPMKGTAAMITRFDRQIGELVAQLERLGIANDTLILFTSDNGPHGEGGNDPSYFDSNGPYRGIKRDLYDGGIRVPMIAYWPGKVAPGVSDHLSSFDDMLPTFCDLAGVDIPRGVTGVSMKPTLLGEPGQAQRPYLYWEFHEQQGKQAVRLGKWKGVRLKVKQNKDAPVQLYDISADPGEKNDLAKANPDVSARVRAIMDEARTRSEHKRFRFSWEQ